MIKEKMYEEAKQTIKRCLGFIPSIEEFEFKELYDEYEDVKWVPVTDEEGFLVDEYYDFYTVKYLAFYRLSYKNIDVVKDEIDGYLSVYLDGQKIDIK